MKRQLRLAFLLTVGVVTMVRANGVVVFNELMYHPATDEPVMEWLELHNQLAVDVDISGWSITGGIDYIFASNTIVRGRGLMVVALSPETLKMATGKTNVLGPFTGRLSNNGELLRLRNNSGRVMDEVEYGVDGAWPVAPDGSGVSLAKRERDSASGTAANWTVSEQSGGTPGDPNFPLLEGTTSGLRLIAVDAVWKYEASGTDLGTAWREVSYNDSAWSSRVALTNRAVPTLFNTGVNASGGVLAPGVRDPHYLLTAAAQGTTGTNAVVISNHPNWLANDTVSSWIGVLNPGTANVNPGGYDYLTGFSLTGFLPSTVRINLAVGIDNDVTNVFLNGGPTGLSFSGFGALSPPLLLSTGFSPGTNTLEFRTVNQPPGANPAGFRAVLSSSGLFINTNTPLPLGRTTYYFRKAFVFAGAPALVALELNPIVADGAVFYLNGVEVHRQNMPNGGVSHATPALADVGDPASGGSSPISAVPLVHGTNVLAVELHQAAASSDVPLLGVELLATAGPASVIRLAFNEVAAGTNAAFWLELANYGTNTLALDNFLIRREGIMDSEYAFSPGLMLPGGAYFAVTNSQLGFQPAVGDRLDLITVSRDRVLDAVVVKERLYGRSPDGTGRWLSPNQPTPRAANSVVFRREMVINEILYHHQLVPPTNHLPARESPEAWLELFNRSTNTVDLTGWELDGGIQYRFSPGKTVGPGGYLVVADDAGLLRALYPGRDIVGNFGGRLSGKSDLIVLKDAMGNPADEVRYFDGGRWPEYADGGGSSLELRDPNADNSKAEAWAASDETGKSSWQTYTYRMSANIPAGSGQPTRWQDFVLGLQSGGECLIDDLTVIESPTNAPIQIIANGDFENGLTGWRRLGTHRHSRVESEAGNPGNHVLHLIASGPQEHMHNHIETTLTGGRTIVSTRLYEISFRARWLAGNNLMNTRLYFNRVARTSMLPVPALNGTPGAQNSRYAPNVGPTFSGLAHQRVVPAAGEPVQVSVAAEDPQGVSSARVFWSVNSGAWNNAAMTSADGLHFTGTIPGQGAGAVVQFYVEATDGLGVSADFPSRGPDSGALYKVEDSQANLALTHNVRIIMTPANTDLMHGTAQGVNQTNVMSNELLPCTLVYDERRAYYDIGVHLRGSQRGRYSDIRTGFHVTFQPDDLFRGVHPVMLLDRSGAGDATANRQEEIVLKHILNRAGGIPGTYSEICRVLAPRNAHTGPAQFFPRHEDLFIETAFDNGGDGTMFEMELIYYPTSANAAGYKNPQPDDVIGTDITDLTGDKEFYRYNFMIKNHRDADDYSRFIALGKAWSLSGAALDAQTRQLMDMDQWMRAYALISLCSVGDMYTFGNNHNFFMYVRPTDGKFLYFPWDMDFAFTRGANGGLVGDQNLGKIVNLPGNLRSLYAHMLDIIGISFNTSYMSYWTDHYDNFAPGQNYAGSLNTIGQRATFVRNTINSQGGTNFNVNGTNFITTSNNLVTLAGTAPVSAKGIKVNGIAYPLTWTSVSAWRMVIPLSEATNVLNLAAYDLYDRPLTNLNRTVTVNYTGGTPPDPQGQVVINEIMYNPAAPDAAYVELFNTSTTFSYDLSDWRVNGLDFTFPKGSLLTNRQFLVLAASMPSYAAAYGTSAVAAFAQFNGNLQNDGETLTLLRPGAGAGEEIIVDRVRYEGRSPWPALPNGLGPSLQLIDARQDNSRVANWSDGAGWRFYSLTGTPGNNATNLLMFLVSAGDLYVDAVSLVEGSVAEAGQNLIVNGGFESGDLGPWLTQGNHADSIVTNAVAYDGSYSMHLIASGAGGGAAHLAQPFATLAPAGTYTFSFWYLPSANGSGIHFRITTGFRSLSPVDFRPVFSSPGSPNSAAGALAPFPPLWLNEVQAENLVGLMDNQGEREPWIEIYNAGAEPVEMSGYYLADNYTNLARWGFPTGAAIQPGEFKIVIADGEPGETTTNQWHTGFRLGPGSGSVALSWSPGGVLQLLDYLNYTGVPAGRSYGDFPDGQPFQRQEFFRATPGAANDNTAPPLPVVINEWMAANTRTVLNTNNNNRYDDWFELYNPGQTAADLGGYLLTDNLMSQARFTIPPGFVIPPQGYLLVWADNEASLSDTNRQELHVDFALSRDGESIGLFTGDGALLDAVTFEPQFSDISQGRYPDASDISYFLATATPRGPNSIWANRYPALEPIAGTTIVVGQPFSFAAQASDPDAPPQTLRFSLDPGAPLGAVIDPSTGTFAWTPTAAPSTNSLTVRVTDNGTPPLSAARTFQLVVGTFRVSDIGRAAGGNVSITFPTTPGQTYRVEYKNDLSEPTWTLLGAERVAVSSSLTILDNIGASSQRFYRVLETP